MNGTSSDHQHTYYWFLILSSIILGLIYLYHPARDTDTQIPIESLYLQSAVYVDYTIYTDYVTPDSFRPAVTAQQPPLPRLATFNYSSDIIYIATDLDSYDLALRRRIWQLDQPAIKTGICNKLVHEWTGGLLSFRPPCTVETLRDKIAHYFINFTQVIVADNTTTVPDTRRIYSVAN